MSYVYLRPTTSGDPYTVGYYDPDGNWQPESDHTTPEAAAKQVRFLNGGDTAGQQHWHLTQTPGIRVCGNDEPNSASTDRISKVTCVDCLRLKALALEPSGMTVPEAVQLMRSEELDNRHREIGIDIRIHNESLEIQFSAYDGREHYYGATLEGAVKSLLVANNIFSGSQDEVDRIVREAMEYQQEKL